MGNTNATSQMSNHSKSNIRIFVTTEALELDAFITSHPNAGDDLSKADKHAPGSKKFKFREDIKCIRVLASLSHELPWEAHQFVSIFVEDEDDENICSKQITQNLPLTAPITVLLYDV